MRRFDENLKEAANSGSVLITTIYLLYINRRVFSEEEHYKILFSMFLTRAPIINTGRNKYLTFIGSQ